MTKIVDGGTKLSAKIKERQERHTANNALAKNGAGPANISCSSLSAFVWGWTFPIDLKINFEIFVFNSISLAGHDQQRIPRTSPMQNVSGHCKVTRQ